MDIKRLLMAGCCCVPGALNAAASPPTGIVLTYDMDKKVLEVKANHPSERLEREYLRRIVIYKNDAQADEVTLPRQKMAWGIDEFIPFEAKEGDKIAVEIFSSTGGTGKGEVALPVAPKKDAKK